MTAAGRMVKQTFSEIFSNYLSGSCFAHDDKPIASVKTSMVNNKHQRAKFPAVNSPSQPVATRRGSWLKAAEYNAKHLHEVCEIVNAFEGTGLLAMKENEAVVEAENLFKSSKNFINVMLYSLIKESTKCIVAKIIKGREA